jgi:hypothetical protein
MIPSKKKLKNINMNVLIKIVNILLNSFIFLKTMHMFVGIMFKITDEIVGAKIVKHLTSYYNSNLKFNKINEVNNKIVIT